MTSKQRTTVEKVLRETLEGCGWSDATPVQRAVKDAVPGVASFEIGRVFTRMGGRRRSQIDPRFTDGDGMLLWGWSGGVSSQYRL
jgi:hypothetical protein